jgi:RNA polymerase sigma-70 factor (ECF subfamily)
MTQLMTIGPTFDDVLAAARTGADWAMAILYRELNPSLLRYLRAQHREAAEDLTSEVWLAAATNLGSFEGDEIAFRRWMFTIARRRAIDYGRQRARRRTDPTAQETFDRRAARDDTAAAGIEDLSAQEAIARLTACLPQDQAEVVLLRVVAGMDTPKVAEIMGRSVGAIRVLQHRALKRLAIRYQPEQEGVTG